MSNVTFECEICGATFNTDVSVLRRTENKYGRLVCFPCIAAGEPS
ncbi:hypothetical protein [Nesterenkonia sp. K-15-9-6]